MLLIIPTLCVSIVLSEVLFLTGIIIFFFKNFDKKNIKANCQSLYPFLIIYLFILIRTLFSWDISPDSYKIIFYFRYIILSIIFFELIRLKIISLRNLYFTFFFSFFVLILSIIIEYIYVTYTSKNITYIRVSGLFGDEMVAGSYLSKFFFSFLSIFFLIKKKFSRSNLFFFILFFLAVFLTGERAAFITLFFFFILFLFVTRIKYFLKILGVFTLILFFIFTNDKNIFNRYVENIFDGFNEKVYEKNYLPAMYQANIITTYKILSDNIFFGSGYDSFRHICKKDKFNPHKINNNNSEEWNRFYKLYLCQNHPHNYYLQVSASFGIVGLIFLTIFYLNFIKRLIIEIKQKNINYSKVSALFSMIFLLFPLTTSGNLFNNWISIILFINYGIYLYIMRIK
ncbi:O-antigen ligase family protein [Pelagibacteraceae bacterium]|nr:O-antigen ligase family protein [Pelagibacteraceae bacterium]